MHRRRFLGESATWGAVAALAAQRTTSTFAAGASDNGEAGKDPFRGAKGGIWEGGLRIPMSLTWPGHIAAGRGSEAPVCTYDILPTLCGLAGVKPSPAGGVLDGVDIGPLLSGD
jgi:arylsulfatase A-like enzyme